MSKITKVSEPKSKQTRIAIINKEKCRPTKCNFECGLICPVNRQDKECIKIIDIEDMGSTKSQTKKIASINENFCIGCGLCTKDPQNGGCPFGAVMIVNIPTELQNNIVHRYGPNGFRLYKMPVLKPGLVLGLIGQNGIGKTTIVNILSGKLKPNFEQFDNALINGSVETLDKNIIQMFKGNEMHKYMTKLYSNQLKISIKPQLVEALVPFLKSKNVNPTVEDYINRRSEYEVTDPFYLNVVNTLGINLYFSNKVITLSGGELQRLVCAVTLLSKSNVYIFDEYTNYLDTRQRLKMSELIKLLVGPDIYVIIIEHDLSILDYVSDEVSILYGVPNAYGVVSRPMGTAVAINSYFDGFIQAENMRFRTSEYDLSSINVSESSNMKFSSDITNYDGHIINLDNFELTIQPGTFPLESSITLVMGKNGTGKTTLINWMAEQLRNGTASKNTTVSHKPQYLTISQFAYPNGEYPTVSDFLLNSIRDSFTNEVFKSDVVRPLDIEKIKDIPLNELSGGNLQKVWIVYCLGQPAQIYLLDEPSANVDIEARFIIAKVIKKFTIHNKKVMFIVEHDMMINVAFGAEQNTQAIIVDIDTIENQFKKCTASTPVEFSVGINRFLQILGVTFHTTKNAKRPRINKMGSQTDREQKAANLYYN